MKRILKLTIIVSAIGLLSSCVSEYYKAPAPTECVKPNLTANKTVADIYAIAINPIGLPIPNTPTYTTTGGIVDYIEGYVISSDEGGNFFKSMYVQPLDKSKGFNISLDLYNNYAGKYQPGSKVFVKLNGLAYGNPTSFAQGLTFGAPPTDKFVVDRLSDSVAESYLIPSCDAVSEDLLVNKITIAQARSSDAYVNTLVEFTDVQFKDTSVGGVFASQTSDTNTTISDGANDFVIRTSKFSKFGGSIVPKGNGTIRGVLTKYNSTYQIVLRTLRDLKLTKPRIVSPSSPLGGTTLVYSGILNEPFTSFAVGDNSFASYITDKITGTKYWTVKQYPANTGNKYIELSTFAGNGNPATPTRSYFMVPVNFDAANTFSFKKEVRYNKGACLKVYYMKLSDYVSGFLNPDYFVDITSSFNITYPAIDASQNSFDSAGTYNIDAALTGNGFFIFEYTGTTTITTTMQIDDIVIN